MSRLETQGRQIGAFYGAADLLGTDFPEPRWAVEGLIPEGLTVLAGSPKLGKSWFTLGLGLVIASGGDALGKIGTRQGDVLVCALEDPPRRLKSRLVKLLDGQAAPERLSIVTELPPLLQATDLIAEWLDEHPEARLVVIDVLAKIRPPSSNAMSAYEADYRVIGELKRLADLYGVAVVCVTHVRKMAADDPFDQVAGSTGLTGAADATVVLRRTRNENGAALHVTGRDVLESEYAVTFNTETCHWTLDGDSLTEAGQAANVARVADGVGDKAAAILALLAKHPDGLGPTDVGRQLDLPAGNAGTYLQRLEQSGRVHKVGRGKYRLAPVESVESVETSGGSVVPFPRITHFPHDHADD